MLKFVHKNKGSISIFLCIILFPMITYCTLIIDASRMQACRTQLQSAGDLTMNAALSEYEKILEDMYGLFAISDDPAVLKPALQNYFYETISGKLNSEGSVNAECDQYIQKWTNDLTDLIFSDGMSENDISNFMSMTLESFEYSPVEESRVSNPMVMKSQIIDYMKYKGPVSVVTGLMTKIGLLKDSSNQVNATEKKIEYAQKVQELDDPMKKIWDALEGDGSSDGYNDVVKSYNVNYATKQAVYNMVKYMYTQSEIVAVNIYFRNTYLNNLKAKTGTGSASYDSVNADDIINGWDKLAYLTEASDATKAKQKLSEIENAINSRLYSITDSGELGEFEKAYGNISISFSSENPGEAKEVEISPITSADSTNNATLGNISAWEKEVNNCLPSSESEKVMLRNFYLKTNEAINHYDDVKKFKAYVEYHEKLRTAYSDIYDKYKSSFTEEERKAFEAKKVLFAKVSAELKDCDTLKANKAFLSYFSSWAEFYGKYCPEKPNEAFTYYYGCVYTLYVKTKAALDASDDLLKKIDEVKISQDNWNSAIGKVEDDSVKSQMKSDYTATIDSIKKEDVQAFRKIIEAENKKAEALLKDIKSVTFCGVMVGNNLFTFDAQKNNTELAGETGNKTLDELIKSFEEKKMTNLGGSLVPGYDHKSSASQSDKVSDNAKTFELMDGKKIDENGISSEFADERFYYVLKNSYGRDLSQKSEEDEQKDNVMDAVGGIDDEKASESVENADKEKGKDSKKEDDKKEESKNGSKSEVGDSYKKIKEKNVAAEVDEDFVNTNSKVKDSKYSRDDFSSSSSAGKSSLSGIKAFLKLLEDIAKTVANHVYLEEYFTEMFTCQTDKKKDAGKVQLLNGYANVKVGSDSIYKPINTDNGWYGKEIEFILWGDTDLDDNITKTDATIFLIRFALNTIYAFTAADIQTFANSLAVATVGWTVVLVPIVQVCITLGIALAESALDLAMLKNGEDVVVIKDSTTFICSPAGLLTTVAKKAASEAITAAAKYATEKVNDVASKTEAKVNEYIDKAEQKVGKTINDCVDEVNGIVSTYADSFTQTIKDTIRDYCITPLTNSITPILNHLDDAATNAEKLVDEKVDAVWDAIGQNIESMADGLGDNTGIVKALVKDFYENYASPVKDDIKKELTQKIKAGVKSVTDGFEININVDELQKVITDKINSKLDDFKGKIVSAVTEKTNALKDEIMSHGHEAVTNLKNYVHQGISNVTGQITGRINDMAQNAITEIGNTTADAISKPASGGLTLNYKEYCKIFVFINLLAGNEEKMLLRAAALIECNVKHAAERANSGFDITSAYSLIYIGAEAKMKTLFPWAVEVSADDSESAGGASLDFSNLGNNTVTIKYGGMNGF